MILFLAASAAAGLSDARISLLQSTTAAPHLE
jgi:hypothetical protein